MECIHSNILMLIHIKFNYGIHTFHFCLEGGILMAKLKQDISIGNNLKQLRKNAELSQEEAAAKLQLMGFNISREIISQMELGRYNIRISILFAFKQIYHVSSFDEFFQNLSL